MLQNELLLFFLKEKKEMGITVPGSFFKLFGRKYKELDTTFWPQFITFIPRANLLVLKRQMLTFVFYFIIYLLFLMTNIGDDNFIV